MEKEQVEFKLLDSKLVGSDTVVFRLEDGTMIKVKVDLRRAGVAVNFKNPDGTPRYVIDANLGIQIIPKSKKFYIPKSKLKVSPSSKKPKLKPI